MDALKRLKVALLLDELLEYMDNYQVKEVFDEALENSYESDDFVKTARTMRDTLSEEDAND